jgi:hypothetical protein
VNSGTPAPNACRVERDTELIAIAKSSHRDEIDQRSVIAGRPIRPRDSISCHSDLPSTFRTTAELRDCLANRRQGCARAGSLPTDSGDSSRSGPGAGCCCRAEEAGGQRADDLRLAQTLWRDAGRRHAAPETIEVENARLKKLLAKRDLEIEIMKEIAAKSGERSGSPLQRHRSRLATAQSIAEQKHACPWCSSHSVRTHLFPISVLLERAISWASGHSGNTMRRSGDLAACDIFDRMPCHHLGVSLCSAPETAVQSPKSRRNYTLIGCVRRSR